MSNELNALLGKGSEFQGKLTFEGSVRIDGRFTGEIFSEGTLIIGEGAQVQAEIRVGSIAVYGNVVGNVVATEAVELHAPASLRGNIASPALHIDKGVFFDGACQMTAGKEERTGTTPPSLPQRQPLPPPRPSSVLPAVGLTPSAPNATPGPRPVHQSGMFVPEPTRSTGELTHKF